MKQHEMVLERKEFIKGKEAERYSIEHINTINVHQKYVQIFQFLKVDNKGERGEDTDKTSRVNRSQILKGLARQEVGMLFLRTTEYLWVFFKQQSNMVRSAKQEKVVGKEEERQRSKTRKNCRSPDKAAKDLNKRWQRWMREIWEVSSLWQMHCKTQSCSLLSCQKQAYLSWYIAYSRNLRNIY